MGKTKRDFTPVGWEPGEKRPYNPIDIGKWIRKHGHVSNGAKVVMEEILDAGGKKGYSFPSMNTIADNCEMCRQNVWLRIQELEEAGHLCIDRTEGTSAVYRPSERLLDDVKKDKESRLSSRVDKGCQVELTGGVKQTLQVGCQVDFTGQIDNNPKDQENPVSDIGKYKREKKRKRKGKDWFDNDYCESIKSLVDTEEKQDLKPPEDNEVDWIISDTNMRDCKISEYGPVGYGKVKYPVYEGEFSSTQGAGMPC